MTDGEIRQVYRSARNRKKQISILAQLNCCSTGRILEIVHVKSDSREEEPGKCTVEYGRVSSEEKALMVRMYELDSKIKILENEYRRTVTELARIGGKNVRENITGN